MIDLRLVLILMVIYGAVWVTGKVAHAVDHARVKVEHVVKTAAVTIGHGVKHLIDPEEDSRP